MSRYIVSVDLGQLDDYTSIVVAELFTRQNAWLWQIDKPDLPPMINLKMPEDFVFVNNVGTVRNPNVCARLHIRHIERFRGKSYPDVARHMYALMRRSPLIGAKMLVDATGVGRPVLQMIREGRVQCSGITITGGRDESRHPTDYRDWLVPKRLLIQSVDALMHRDAIKIAPELSEATNLQYELNDFRSRIDPETGYESFSARTSEHDDVVLALAQICWHATIPERTVTTHEVYI